MLKQWHEYGKAYNVFVPDEQPAPKIWDRPLAEPGEKGTWDPQTIKHWRFFELTRDFLRTRYADHGILPGPALIFDCLIRKFQPRFFNKSYQDQHGNPVFYEVNDSYEWYERAIRMDIFGWQVGFSCRSNLCERDWCLLNRRNPKKIVPVDIYSLISIFEGISVAVAKAHVAKWFGMKLGEFESKGIRPSTRLRRKVSKKEIVEVLARYKNVRTQHVTALIAELAAVIQHSGQVEWHRRMFDEDYMFLKDRAADNLYKINGPAAKAYVWLLIRQEELARDTRGPKLNVSDSELAEAIGISKPSAQTYRKTLIKLKLVEVKELRAGTTAEIRIVKAKY